MDVTCILPLNADLKFLGRALAGIYELPGTEIRLRFEGWMTSAFSIAVEVDEIRYGIDLSDHSDAWDLPLLQWSQIYAKRSIHKDHSPLCDANKIVPYGLYCSGTSKRSILGVLRTLALARPAALLQQPKSLLRYLRVPHWRSFEQPPTVACDATIFFQTRIWDPREAPGDEQVNAQRISLLEDLKRHFRRRLIGGLVPNAYGLKLRPDLVTKEVTRQSAYLELANRSAIGIYSRGLFHSQAFKLAEFLAGSKCIVSDVIENALSAPLARIAIYRTNEECIAHCEALLTDGRAMQDCRDASWQYYTAYVRPRSLIERLLQLAVP